ALGGQTVDQQGEVDLLALGAHLAAVGFKLRRLVLEDHLRVVEQTPDQSGLAVIHRPAGQKAQQRLVLMSKEIGVDVLLDEIGYVGHQKYPSCFFFSMDAAWSWSITRPWRSEVVVRSISWMISGRVAAV